MNIKLTIAVSILFISIVAILTMPFDPALTANTKFSLAAFILVAAIYFLLWPAMRKQDLDAIETLPGALEEIRKHGREYYRNTSAIQENSAAVIHFSNEVLLLKRPLEELLIERRQELMLLNNDFKLWREAVIRYFDYLYRSMNLDGIDEVRQQTYSKVAADFMRELRPLGFDIIQPQQGDIFDEHFHEVKSEIEHRVIAPGEILSVEGIGFRLNGKCIKAAPVIITKKPVQNTEESLQAVPNNVTGIAPPQYSETQLTETGNNLQEYE